MGGWYDSNGIPAPTYLPGWGHQARHPPTRPLQEKARPHAAQGEQHNEDELDKLKLYTDEHLMSVNQKKTKVFMYNKIRKYDFPPELQIGGSQNI